MSKNDQDGFTFYDIFWMGGDARLVLAAITLIVIVLSLVLQEDDAEATNIKSVNENILIKYDLDGISLEGTEATVQYFSDSIKSAVIHVYGETGKADIYYTFKSEYISVTEIIYRYSTDLNNLKSKEDLTMESKLDYQLDYNGYIMDDASPTLNIYSDFKTQVPFVINDK